MQDSPYTLITGASSGIGKELASIAAENGNHLVLVARDEQKLEQHAALLKKQHGVKIEVITADLSLPASPQAIYDQLQEANITIDTLINNAGFGDYDLFHTSDRPRQLAMIDLNIRSLTELTHLFLPGFVQRGAGQIMNLGSIASFLPGPYMSVYFASKAYVLSFSEALAEELRGSGVSVTCLCPGSTKTQFGNSAHVSETHSTRTSNVTPRQVAEYGWRALENKQVVAVYGLKNRASLFVTQLLPRSLVRKLVRRIQT